VIHTLLTTLAVMALLTANSYAVDWIIVPGAKVGGDIICLDRDNVVNKQGIISAWIKRISKGGNYTKTLLAFDCAMGKTMVVESVEFDKASKMITKVDYESIWEISAPETPATVAAMMICKKGKKFNPALISMKRNS